jgi:hypothetical protein
MEIVFSKLVVYTLSSSPPVEGLHSSAEDVCPTSGRGGDDAWEMCSGKLFMLDDEVLLSHALNDPARPVHCAHAHFLFLPICIFHCDLLFLCYWVHILNYKMCNC